jgi:hypothetical protein
MCSWEPYFVFCCHYELTVHTRSPVMHIYSRRLTIIVMRMCALHPTHVKLSSKSRLEAGVCSAGRKVGRASAVGGVCCASRGICTRAAAEGGMKRRADSTTLDVGGVELEPSSRTVGASSRTFGASSTKLGADL